MHPISEILLDVYKRLAELEHIDFPVAAEHERAIDSIVKTVHADYFGKVRFSSLEVCVAAYFYFIIKDHPVIEGNKRLAVLWVTILCDVWELRSPHGATQMKLTLDQLAVAVEKTSLPQDELIDIIRRVLFDVDGRV